MNELAWRSKRLQKAPVLKERSGPRGRQRSAASEQLGALQSVMPGCAEGRHAVPSARREGGQLWTLKLCTHALYTCMYVCMEHEISLSKTCVFSILA